jgi:ParB/RepB/Spo0J family partition protein
MVKTGLEEEEGKQYNTTPEETEAKVTQKMKNRGKKSIEKKTERLEELKVEYVPIDSIKPNEYNPNRQSEHDFELLCSSMKEDGFTQPILCLQKTKTIVDGEHRWRAAHALGYKEIPVVFVNMTAEQMRISTLRHNRARGSEDLELSVQVLRDLQELGAIEWAQDSLMLSDEEINRLLEDISVPEQLANDGFSQAWEPTDSDISKDKPDAIIESVSSIIKDDVRLKEKKLKEAKTIEERTQLKKESNIYRITLIFAKADEEIIKKCLGDNPADRILQLCKAQKEAQKSEQ